MTMMPADNSIMAGIAKVNSYLAGKPGVPHIITGEDPGPLLYVCEDLTWFFDEIGSYYWKRNPQMNFTDEPVDDNDHAMYVAKYILSRLPLPADIVLPRTVLPPDWMYWHEMEVNDYKRAVRR